MTISCEWYIRTVYSISYIFIISNDTTTPRDVISLFTLSYYYLHYHTIIYIVISLLTLSYHYLHHHIIIYIIISLLTLSYHY